MSSDLPSEPEQLHAVDVDVVIVSWNVRSELIDCVASLQASDGVRARIVVVDNNSDDGSADVIEERFPQVELVRNPTNEGFAKAVNKGIAAGEARYVLVLNPDTVVSPAAVAAMVARLDELPHHGVLAPRLVGADHRAQHSVYLLPSLAVSLLVGTGIDRVLPRAWRARLLLEGSWQSDTDRDVPWAIGAALMVRRAAIDQVGPLDERLFIYAEDMEWCERFWRGGWRVRFDPSTTVTHLGNRSGQQRFGEDRTAAYMHSTVAYLKWRRGLPWTAAFVAINGSATVVRFWATWLAMRLRPTPARRARLGLWRGHARFYLGLARRP